MSEEIKKALENVKEVTATLVKSMKEDAENRAKHEALIEDLKAKQDKFEKEQVEAKKRKGVFDDEEDAAPAIKHKDIEALVKTKTSNEGIIELQNANDDIMTLSQVLGVDPRETKLYRYHVEHNPFLKKALYSTGSATGDEWVPTGYSAQLYDIIRLQQKCASLHPRINMPTNPYTFPVVLSDIVGYQVSEATADTGFYTASSFTASTPGTGNFTLTAVKLGARTVFSEEMSEDSIVPVLPFVKGNIAQALANSIETALINGDTSATHLDSDTTVTADVRKAWLGYRRLAHIGGQNTDLGTLNGENLTSLRAKMGKYGVDPSKLVILTSIAGYMRMINMRDNTASNQNIVTTLDKYGPGATILNGELGRVYGVPIIVSESMRQTLNAAGVHDATTAAAVKTLIMFIYRPGFMIGDRRTLQIKSAELIQTDQTMLVASLRMDFKQVYAVASNYCCVYGYNVSNT